MLPLFLSVGIKFLILNFYLSLHHVSGLATLELYHTPYFPHSFLSEIFDIYKVLYVIPSKIIKSSHKVNIYEPSTWLEN